MYLFDFHQILALVCLHWQSARAHGPALSSCRLFSFSWDPLVMAITAPYIFDIKTNATFTAILYLAARHKNSEGYTWTTPHRWHRGSTGQADTAFSRLSRCGAADFARNRRVGWSVAFSFGRGTEGSTGDGFREYTRRSPSTSCFVTVTSRGVVGWDPYVAMRAPDLASFHSSGARLDS